MPVIGIRGSKLAQTLAINSDYKRTLLQGLELFQGVHPEDIQDLLQRCDRRDLATGELLLSPGTSNEHVFIVLSGSLNVHVGSPDAPVLATMESGACVGEMSIIEDRDPSAYVVERAGERDAPRLPGSKQPHPILAAGTGHALAGDALELVERPALTHNAPRTHRVVQDDDQRCGVVDASPPADKRSGRSQSE